jgi:uncharacterized protein (DUF2147 family)
MKLLIFLASYLYILNVAAQKADNDKLNGIWVNKKYNVAVQAYNANDVVYAKLLAFPCSHKIKKPISEHTDEHNPNPKLRTRPMQYIVILSGLKYAGNSKWEGGTVYVPANGKTYKAYVKMKSPTEIEIHGFIGFEIIGVSLNFVKSK